MENPNTWDDITKLIAQTISDYHKDQEEGRIGYSLPMRIRRALEEAHLLLIP